MKDAGKLSTITYRPFLTIACIVIAVVGNVKLKLQSVIAERKRKCTLKYVTIHLTRFFFLPDLFRT